MTSMAKLGTAGSSAALPVKTDSGQLNLNWLSTSASKLGFVRSVNEDAHLDAPEQNLWVVADGMGGHSYGDEASRTIVEQLLSFRASADMHADLDDLQKRLTTAHSLCRNNGNGQLMGSTVVALYVHDPYCFFLWAGDSRIYRYRGDTLDQMTEDHSLVQGLVSIGELRREDMDKHPSSHIITKAVGVQTELELDLRYALAEPGDRYLICSDGLYKDVSENEIAQGMAKTTIDESLNQLVDLALDRGGTDNTTAIVVQAGKSQTN